MRFPASDVIGWYAANISAIVARLVHVDLKRDGRIAVEKVTTIAQRRQSKLVQKIATSVYHETHKRISQLQRNITTLYTNNPSRVKKRVMAQYNGH